MARIDDKVAALETMNLPQLREAWQRQQGERAPALPEPLLRMMLAYRMQEKRSGGAPAMIVRVLMQLGGGGALDPAPRTAPIVIRPGTRLVRSWNGRTIEVLALDEGFRFEDRHYRSLSSIAREVTGARWCGPRFFGLTDHG